MGKDSVEIVVVLIFATKCHFQSVRQDAALRRDWFVLETSGAIGHTDGGAPAVIFFCNNKDRAFTETEMSPFQRIWTQIWQCVRGQGPISVRIFTKMVISWLLNVEKIWNSAQINLSSTSNFYRRYVFDATISTEKSTGEIDADLAQNDM